MYAFLAVALQASGEQLFIQIFTVLGMVLSFVFPFSIFLFWKRIMPPVLRTLFWATRKRQPLLLLCHDSGRSILTTIAERQGEGIVLTAQQRYKILPRFSPKLPLDELIRRAQQLRREAVEIASAETIATNLESENEETEETAAGAPVNPEAQIENLIPKIDLTPSAFDIRMLQESFILDYSDFTNKRSFLMGIDVPIFVGYTGKLCLLNPEALALYEAGEMMVRVGEDEYFNPKGVAGKTAEDAYQPLLLLNPRKIQEMIWKGFDQSQIAGVVADSEELIRQQYASGGMMGGKMKYILLLGLLLVGGIAALLFLPKFVEQFGGQMQVVLSTIRWIH